MYQLGAFAPFQWAARDKILILTYHRFSREAHPHKISAGEFAAHLKYLNNHNRVLPLTDVIEYLQNGKTLPSNTTAITIDDGYADAYEIAFPLLKKNQMPATVYAVTGFLDGKCWLWTDLMRYILAHTEKENIAIGFENDKIESVLRDDLQRLEIAGRINSRLKKIPDDLKDKKLREIAALLAVEIPEKPVKDYAPLSWNGAREMEAENVRIESHSVSHPILTNIAADDLDFELKNSKKRLEEFLERNVEHFCYPNGSLNENVQNAVKNAGYKSATTTNYGFNVGQINRFLLNRIDAPAAIANFAQSVSGFEALRQQFQAAPYKNLPKLKFKARK
jgi:peptidoglycan/xylan/chitin deacetylase (PgdA/CDA1 family)